MAPTAEYKGPSSWDIEPPQALFDTVGYELTAHYMQVQVKRLTPHPFHICKPECCICKSAISACAQQMLHMKHAPHFSVMVQHQAQILTVNCSPGAQGFYSSGGSESILAHQLVKAGHVYH